MFTTKLCCPTVTTSAISYKEMPTQYLFARPSRREGFVTKGLSVPSQFRVLEVPPAFGPSSSTSGRCRYPRSFVVFSSVGREKAGKGEWVQVGCVDKPRIASRTRNHAPASGCDAAMKRAASRCGSALCGARASLASAAASACSQRCCMTTMASSRCAGAQIHRYVSDTCRFLSGRWAVVCSSENLTVIAFLAASRAREHGGAWRWGTAGANLLAECCCVCCETRCYRTHDWV